MPDVQLGVLGTAANRVTLVRAALAGGVAALVVAHAHDGVLVSLATATLLLDVVDGWVARRTNTVTAFGARFDMEVDAFLILALSVAVLRSLGSWVLAIGLARYAFGVAALLLPWLRVPMPPSRWRKLVAAVQGITLTVVVSRVLPDAVGGLAVFVALVLLAQSFGSQVGWLWRERGRRRGPAPRSVRRRMGGVAFSVLSFAVVWFALLAPDHLHRMGVAAFLRIPVEGLVLVGLSLVLPDRARRTVAGFAGIVLGTVLVLRVLDMGYYNVLDRPFNPVTDSGTFGPAIGVLRDAIGSTWTHVIVATAAVIAVAVLIVVPVCVERVTAVAARHRRTTLRATAALSLAWVLAAAVGVDSAPGEPLASASAAGSAFDHARDAGSAIVDAQDFSAALRSADDRYAKIPADRLLVKLRGKDVLLVFVESYGQVAVQGSSFAAQDDALLRAATKELDAAGYGSRSAFLSSPTFGGISWLAHSTLQSGLWVNSQNRYDDLVASQRFTLSDAFKKAGWRTVSDVPSDPGAWRPGVTFYHYDTLYNGENTGYRGPSFGYARIPDQYTLAAFRARELARHHRAPVFAELDLVSSHNPWAPLPHMLPWAQLGDGTPYAGQSRNQLTAAEVWQHTAQVQANYAQSIRYSLTALVSYLTTFHDRNLVLVMLGDHQPVTTVSGDEPTHDVPISVIADDPAVLQSIDTWHWQPGLLPSPSAPVWPMDAFRNRFLDAYGTSAVSSEAQANH